MLYYFFQYLEKEFNFPGAGVFQYISFRTTMAIILSLLISLVFGGRLIKMLHKLQVSETIRDLGLQGEKEKKGTPTMGGLIIIAAIVIPTLLFARTWNVYIILMLCVTVWLGFIGFADDYIKVFKKDKRGLAGKFKVIGQVICGLAVGLVLHYHPSVVEREFVTEEIALKSPTEYKRFSEKIEGKILYYKDIKSTVTTIPFVKGHELDYEDIFGKGTGWIVFILVVILIITAVSNGANLTDGIDGLAAGTSGIMGVTLVILTYLSGNIIFSDYLKIMFIPHLGELTIFVGAFVGACIGFLWYNTYPAQVFMGDTGSLALGGIIASITIIIRKELLVPILCGVFLVETLSVMLQVVYFKYTKRKHGEGRRIFLMAPLHHHYQKKGYHESKIVSRFWIVGIMLALITIITLKLR
ncbi:MAG: phospho-N-acetylmuramoyl-pentapeptide-transferase [Flavobacteriaceae bacterium]|nr:phospho-N-acetylmuramoyl-pentapeptide-transferase [Flavobacteriaceae bacterium]